MQDGTSGDLNEGPAKLTGQFEARSGGDYISVHLYILGIKSGNDFISYSFLIHSFGLSSLFPVCKS
jgi:hypothetical protein